MRSSTPRLSEVARHVVVPGGVVSTGWPAVREKCGEWGIRFRWWQHAVGKIILAKRADGRYAATVGGTGLSIPRQVGKTFLVGAIVFALCLLRPHLTVIWTAHRLRTAEETFGKMQKFASRKAVKPHVAKIVLGSGEEAVEFRNGSRILFGARERGFGRGFDEVDVVVYDEGQILTENALDDMIPAMNQSRQACGALLLFMGTPPKPSDPGEVFTRMRLEALSGEDDDTAWVEFGADPGFTPTPLPAALSEADWRQVAKANPSFPDDTPREAILRMRKKLGHESFLREGLGVWDESGVSRIFGLGAWERCAGPELDGVRLAGLGLAVEADLSRTAVVGAGVSGDRVVVRPLQHGPGSDWAVDRLAELQKRHGAMVVFDGRGPAAELAPRLKARRVRFHALKSAEVYDAFDGMFRLVSEGNLSHAAYPELDAAVLGAVPRPVGDRRMLGRKTSLSDVSPLEAAELAAWWVLRPVVAPPPPVREETPASSSDSADLASIGF